MDRQRHPLTQPCSRQRDLALESGYCLVIKGKDYIGISVNKEICCPTFIARNKGIIIALCYKTPQDPVMKDLL